jgi:hypothetical protein
LWRRLAGELTKVCEATLFDRVKCAFLTPSTFERDITINLVIFNLYREEFMNKCKRKEVFDKLLSGLAIGLAIMAMFALLSSPLEAQSYYGSIVGTVSDASNAVIPGATVTLTNIGTKEKRTAETDAAGSYRFVNLVPAEYRLEVEMAGFKHLTREPIAIAVEAVARIDAKMEVGAVTDTIEVTAQTPLLQTESSSMSQTVEGRQAAEMPLNGRNAMNLIALVPGVVPQGSSAGAAVGNQQAADTGTHTHVQGWGNYQIGGGIAGQSAMFLDGTPLNMGGGGNSIGLVPSQEMVQEFRVATSNVSSEFGRFSGGVVNMVSKTGTNDWHGSAYEYIRNKVLNANYFFMNAAGKPRGAWVQNQFGGSFSGPIIKDKTYFFFNAERYVLKVGTPSLVTVPTAAMKAGDFSALGNIYDIRNGRTQFTNNIIPSNRFDYTANVITNVLKYWPDPNTNLSGGNYASQAASGGDQTQYNVRIKTLATSSTFSADSHIGSWPISHLIRWGILPGIRLAMTQRTASLLATLIPLPLRHFWMFAFLTCVSITIACPTPRESIFHSTAPHMRVWPRRPL